MANVFVYTPAGASRPSLAGKNLTNLLEQVSDALLPYVEDDSETDESDVAMDPKAALFARVAAGEISTEEAMVEMAVIYATPASEDSSDDAFRINGEPMSIQEAKRKFRQQEDGFSVEVQSLDGGDDEIPGMVTMFRL